MILIELIIKTGKYVQAQNVKLKTTDLLNSVSNIFYRVIFYRTKYKNQSAEAKIGFQVIRVLDASRKNIAPAYQVSRAGSKFARDVLCSVI